VALRAGRLRAGGDDGRIIAGVSGGPETTAGGAGPELAGRTVVVVSPHFDDVPLSLGQSLLTGALSQAAAVRVKVVFGRTNWSVRLYPTRRRAPLVTGWRRAEETLAARRFGYRFEVAPFEEVILRTGSTDAESYRGDHEARDDALFLPVMQRLRQWRREGDELWVPAGLGRHLDHRIVAAAAAQVVGDGDGTGPVAFYEDRPYASFLDDAELVGQIGRLGLELEPVDVSGPIAPSTQEAVRRCYRSQIDGYFEAAQQRDLDEGRPERIWRPVPRP